MIRISQPSPASPVLHPLPTPFPCDPRGRYRYANQPSTSCSLCAVGRWSGRTNLTHNDNCTVCGAAHNVTNLYSAAGSSTESGCVCEKARMPKPKNRGRGSCTTRFEAFRSHSYDSCANAVLSFANSGNWSQSARHSAAELFHARLHGVAH